MKGKEAHTKSCVMNRILDHGLSGITHQQLYEELEFYSFSKFDIDCALHELVIVKQVKLSDDAITRIIPLYE